MDEFNEALRVVPELYFLIAKFLSGGPLKETAKVLLKELESVEVLPKRTDWEGNEHTQSYEELASQHRDVAWDRLASVCESALRLARSAAAIAPAPAPAPANGEAPPPAIASSSSDTGAPQPQPAVSEQIAARLSLLSDALVRPRPKYASYKQDHSLVRRLVARELGVGNAALLGGRGGKALMSPRMLSGLQLQRRTLGHLSAVYCLVFDCTGRYVVTGADDLLVKVWSAVDGRLLATLRGAGAEITDVCASADGALLAAGSVERLVRVWCLATGAPLAVLSAHAGTITAVHWAPGGGDVRWLASTSTDGSVCFWTSAADGQFLSRPVQYVERTRPGACHMICAAWSAGGGFLAAGSADHHVRIYMVEGAGGPRRVLEAAVHADAVDSVAWAHRGLRLLSGSKDGTAALWTLHATQWRHCSLVPHAHQPAKLKVTMVCWDCSDQFVMTAVSDNTIRVWCASSCTQVSVLRGHRDEAYVLEPHPFLSGVLLSAGHDGQLFVWQATQPRPLAAYHNHIAGQGDGAIFDAKWGGACTVAASDSHGHLLLLGLGRGPELLRHMPAELFFHTDYRPLVRDALGGALDEQTELPPHLMPPPFLVDVEGAPHPPHMQRLVPGRERLALPQLIPAAAQHARLDRLIQQLAGEREAAEANAIVAAGAAFGLGFGAGMGAGPWRGEGVRHTAGSWQRGDPLLVPHCTRPLVPPLPARHAAALQRAAAEMHALEAAWYRREMRRRPLMISTAPAAAPAPRRRAGRPHAPAARPRPRPAPTIRRSEPPEPESASGSDTSDESVRLSGDAHSSPEPEPSSSDGSSSSASSQYSDWEAGPPARARRRPLPARRYSPSVSTKRSERTAGPAASTSAGWGAGGEPGEPGEDGGAEGASPPRPPAELPEQLRVGEWLTAVSPRKAPYHPQMGDECLYFRLGHQRYFEAVAEKDVYKINPRDKPWERTTIHECEVVKVVGIKYVIKPPRVVCLRLSCALPHSRARRSFTVRYHDMADVIDFLVLRQQYEAAAARRWGPRDRFRCMIDDSWWTGVIIERSAPAEGEAPVPGAGAEPLSAAAAFSAGAAPHFLSLRVRWDNGEVERLSPWDLEPIDPERLPMEPGGAVPVLPSELEAALYKAEPHEWPPAGDRAAACRAIAQHVGQVMSLSVAEPFVAPVDLARYPLYARVVPYPIDLATVRARFDNLFYRRAAAAQWDVRYLASNAEQFNQAHSPIVRQARLVTDLLLCIISEWRSVDVLAKYRELAAAYHSSDDEPLARAAATKQSSRGGWQDWCARVLRELMASADAEPFKQPVSAAMAPDYSSVVTRPMDLGSVTRRLQASEYTQREQFAADVRLVFANSRLYNTNKRSRIYSMTVRLSALFESLWARAPPEPRPRRRRRPNVKLNGSVESHLPPAYSSPPSDSSDSETLAATSRRHHATLARDKDSWDSDAPLHTHRKGKGIGKKSKSSTVSVEPAPSTAATSSATHVSFGASGSGTGRGWASPDASSATTSPPHSPRRRDHDDDDDARDRDPHRTRGIRRRRGGSSDSGSSDWRTPHHKRPRRHKFKRTRERFSAGSSSASSSSAASAPRRYSSDRSYRPRYSTDDDAPLHLYRQRQGGTNEESTSAGPAPRRKLNGHAAGVSLRARGSPRRYNEQSDSDSCAAISKRSQHRRARDVHLARRRHHAQNTAVNEDHNYFNGHVVPAAPAPAPAPALASVSAPAHAHAMNGDGSSSSTSVPAVSISSRGRVRKLTAKARGLLRD